MDASISISAAGAILTMIVMSSAAISDWRTREVSDRHWSIIGGAGIAFHLSICITDEGVRWEFLANALSGCFVLASFLWGTRDQGVVLCVSSILLMTVSAVFGRGGEPALRGALATVFCILYYIMYLTGVLRGGADAKCLIALSLALPTYPSWVMVDGSGVGGTVMPVSLGSMILADLMVVVAGLSCFVAKARRTGDGFSFKGYRMPVDEAENAFVWPVEDVVDGEVRTTDIPGDEDLKDVYGRLRAAGRRSVYVTPMVPFIVPLTIATSMSVTLGNPLLLFI